MPVFCNPSDDAHRVREKATGLVARNRAGTPLDGGGHPSHKACQAQAAAINANIPESDLVEVRLAEAGKRKTAVEAAISRNLTSMDKLEEEAVVKVHRYLRQARTDINAAINGASGFNAFYLPQMRDEVTRALEDFERKYLAELQNAGEEIEDLATALVKEPLVRSGIDVAFPRLPATLPEVLSQFHADQIKGISQEAIRRITTKLSLGILGGSNRADVIASIAADLPSPLGAGSITKRVQRIVRTEVNRVHAAVTQVRMEQAQEEVPDLKKYWLTAMDKNVRPSHQQAGIDYGPENAIPVDQEFIVGGQPGQYPRDPRLPAEEVVNCRCRSVPVVPKRRARRAA